MQKKQTTVVALPFPLAFGYSSNLLDSLAEAVIPYEVSMPRHLLIGPFSDHSLYMAIRL